MATENPSDAKTVERDVVSIELPAPAGWKKLTPKKGASAGRKDIVFIAPDGEEIKTKSQLRGYLKSHPSGVTFKEFDWSTGDTPRRSSRLSGKSKASESPENETPQKRQRKSSSKEAKKENDDGNEDEGATFESAKEGIEDAQAEHDEKDETEDPAKGVVAVGEPAVEEEKVAEAGQVAANEENKAATEEEKSEVKEKEAAVVEEQKEQEVVAEEQKEDVVEEAADMDILLGTDGNTEATEDTVKEELQLETKEINKEGNQVSGSSSSSKQPIVEEKAVDDNSVPSQVSEEANKPASEYWSADPWPSADAVVGNVAGEGPSDFLPDEFLDVGDALPDPEELGVQFESADPTPAEEVDKEDTVRQEANREEK